jgi:hypothetical protein
MSEILPIQNNNNNNNKKSTWVLFFFFLKETKGRFVPLDVWETIAGTLDEFHFLDIARSRPLWMMRSSPSGYNLI